MQGRPRKVSVATLDAVSSRGRHSQLLTVAAVWLSVVGRVGVAGLGSSSSFFVVFGFVVVLASASGLAVVEVGGAVVVPFG